MRKKELDPSPRPTIIYIAGYGRSGSTLLDIILGAHPEATSLGEVGRLWELYYSDREPCSCGLKYCDCPFWSRRDLLPLNHDTPRQMAYYRKLTRHVEGWRALPQIAFASGSADQKRTYAEVMTHLFTGIARATGKKLLVDSSKTSYGMAWRPLALHKLCGFEVRMVHLVRDVRGVMGSYVKGCNIRLRMGEDPRIPFSALRALYGWLVANLFAVVGRFFLPSGCYQLFRYEDLIRCPDKELTRMGRFLNLDLEDAIQRIQTAGAFQAGHFVAGNRLAGDGEVRVRLHSEPPTNLKLHHRLLAALWAWPMTLYAALAGHK
jgi:hypothetical protein